MLSTPKYKVRMAFAQSLKLTLTKHNEPNWLPIGCSAKLLCVSSLNCIAILTGHYPTVSIFITLNI